MKKVIIIGAGPAGLTAGLELLRKSKDYHVLIVEEGDAVGGISRTVRHNGNLMDVGVHRFFSKDQRVNDWWQGLMPLQGKPAYDDIKLGRNVACMAGGPDPEREDRVMLKRNRITRIYYRRRFFDYPVKMNANTIKNMGAVTTVAAGMSYLRSVIAKRPEDSLENFYINRFGKKLYSMFFESYTEKLWGRHPRDISADWGAQRVKGLSVLAIIKDIGGRMLPNRKSRKVETSLIEEFIYPKLGAGQMWELAAQEFRSLGGEIRTGCRVKGFTRERDNIASVIWDVADGEVTENADIVISSMPLKDLVAGMKDVPENIRRIAEGLPYREFVTVGVLLKKMDLANETNIKTLNNVIPDSWIYVQEPGVKLGRIQVFNNWSSYMMEKPEDTVMLGLEYFCSEGDQYWNMSAEQWKNFGVKELIAMGVIASKDDVLDYHCEKVRKAYPAYFDTYAEIDTLVEWLNGIGNLYCIGRNGQHHYNNMDHSMVTAFEAVGNILHGIKDKTNIWSVNTEQEYHEEKYKNA